MHPKERSRWLQTIAADRSLPPLACCVAVLLARYVDSERGTAFPGNDHLAADTGLHRVTVIRLLRTLTDNGYLEKAKGGGRGRATVYRLVNSNESVTVSETRKGNVSATDCGSETVVKTVVKTVAETVTPALHQPTTYNLRSPPPIIPPLPEWLSEETWVAWETHRREIRKKLTPSTRAAQFRKLDKLRAEGHDPAAVIEHSIAGGWTGLFPPDVKGKINGNGQHCPRKLTSGERIAKLIRDADEALAAENGASGDDPTVATNGRGVRDE